MPNFDFKCDKCGKIIEKNVPSNIAFIICDNLECQGCKDCAGMAWKMPSAPAFKVK